MKIQAGWSSCYMSFRYEGGDDSMTIRKAEEADIPAITAIYDALHDQEEAGETTIGWIRGVYPTEATARAALEKADLFVLEDEGKVMAAARINREQVDVYKDAPWQAAAPDDEVMVLHTLVVNPQSKGKGYGTAFVAFYEEYALSNGCRFLRMDTNEKNSSARRLYAHLGYREAGIVPCIFNGIPGVNLVCLEKTL